MASIGLLRIRSKATGYTRWSYFTWFVGLLWIFLRFERDRFEAGWIHTLFDWMPLIFFALVAITVVRALGDYVK